MDLHKASRTAASGMQVQVRRMRVLSENIANSDSVASRAGGVPYRRQIISFKTELDRETNANLVQVRRIGKDWSDFRKDYDPGHPYADKDGYLLKPNVNPLLEMVDMQQAQRTYRANLNVIETVRSMVSQGIRLLTTG